MGQMISPAYMMNLLARMVVLMTALPVHEFAHAWAAYKMGDSTAKDSGRLTLNPLAHLDPRGSLLILIAGFGFAKPVPVDPRNFKNRRAGELVTSIAGPASNILLAFVLLCLTKIGFYGTTLYATPAVSRALAGPLLMIEAMVYINCSLAVFNLLPVPPLDGWHVLAQFVPRRVHNWLLYRQQTLSLIMVAAVVFGLLDGLIGLLSGHIVSLLFTLTGFIEPLFGF